jgi:hypothetical protein
VQAVPKGFDQQAARRLRAAADRGRLGVSMSADDGYWAQVDTVWNSISIYDSPEVFARQFSQSPVVARTLFAAHWCQSEVRNGGFHQFFFNSTGILAPEALEAFRTLQLADVASVLERAMSRLGAPYPRLRSARKKQLQLLEQRCSKPSEVFTDLDDEFFEVWGHGEAFKTAADGYADA